MGASAIRLVIAEIAADGSIHVMEEASRGILLGRDTFSSGVIPARTIDATLAALEGFHHLIQSYGVEHVRAVATSAVREAQMFDTHATILRIVENLQLNQRRILVTRCKDDVPPAQHRSNVPSSGF
jgi:exopolyphosphatase/guanosine-5'-triphosphate,3'-diphosphate pyrophosphatase